MKLSSLEAIASALNAAQVRYLIVGGLARLLQKETGDER